MAEWGRKEYSKKWPSRTPVWTWMAIFLSLLFFAGMLTVEYEGSWTAAERLYLSDYLKSGTRGKASATAAGKYTLLEGVVGKSQRLVTGDEVELVPGPNGRPGYRLTDEGVKAGIARLTWVTGTFNDRGLHKVMSEAVYAGHESWDFYQKAVYLSLAFFVLALFEAVPKDRARRMLYKHGRRLRGPELVTTAELNEKLGKSKLLTTHLPDGVSFINEEQTWTDKLFRKNLSRWARVPRDREAMHFLIVGDSGTGKSAAIRQILAQVWERNEAAIVYDPAMEYLPQFYNEARGDVILNPMDERGRFMSPDPSGLMYADPTNPQSLNLYSYGLNSPLSNIDPDGLSCITLTHDGGTSEQGDDGDGQGCAAAGIAGDGTVDTNKRDTVNVNPPPPGSDLDYDTRVAVDQQYLASNQLQPAPASAMYLQAIGTAIGHIPNVCSVGINARVGAGRVSVGVD